MRVTALSAHRLLVTSVLVATKFLDDSYYSNVYFAKVGGVSLTELNGLEVELLLRLDFRLHVLPEEFEAVCASLCERLQPAEELPRRRTAAVEVPTLHVAPAAA